MPLSRAWILPVTIGTLTFGYFGADLGLTGEHSPLPNDHTLFVVEETPATQQSEADESAKMGEESGTHAGDEAATPETDTKKVDQPPRQNPTTSN
jgi:hypothetical protein